MTGLTTILGFNGLIGRKLLPLLREGGVSTRTVGRSGGDIPFDWDDAGTFKAALAGSISLYLVPPAMVADPAPQVEHLLRVAREVGVARVVVVSSLGLSFPTEPPGSERHRYEDVVKASGLPWSIVRPSGFMQNFSEGFMTPGIKHAGMIFSAAGAGAVAMVDSNDIAAAVLALLTQPDQTGKTFELTGPQAHTFAEMAAMISAVAGRPIGYQAISIDQMRQRMHEAGVTTDYADILLRDQRAISEGAAAKITTDIRELTGRPPTSFQHFVEINAPAWGL
ncbi:MAG: NmrA family protein [Caulobacter sp.]|nr:NmrA family protein [Caulobacter sp.]